jgi:hypothetical protein
MWGPQPLTTLWASTACYRDSFYLVQDRKNITIMVSQSLHRLLYNMYFQGYMSSFSMPCFLTEAEFGTA